MRSAILDGFRTAQIAFLHENLKTNLGQNQEDPNTYINEKEINFYKKHNVSVFSWTNKNHITRRGYPDNIDGIITDYLF